jgi:protein TonB
MTAIAETPDRLYGAPELKETIKKNTRNGFIAAMILTLLLFLLYYGYSALQSRSARIRKAPVAKIKLENLPPPPQQAESAPPPPPPQIVAGPAARAGTPVPVPDALIAPDVKDFAKMDEVSRASTTGGDGSDQGFLGLASDKVEVEVRENEPDAYDFIPVEKEPSIDIKELQKRVIYPELAKRAGIEGKVTVRVLVGKNGAPKKYMVESTDSETLNQAAVDAIMKSVFTPAIQNNQPIDCWVSIPVLFKLK